MAMMNILSAILIAFTCLFSAPDNQRNVDPDSWKVTVDEVRDGVRYVTAVPGGGVCSRRIELEIVVKGRTVRSCRFVGGCPGNTVGLCSLLEGMKVSEAIKRLDGIPCGGKETSCPDQLARVLKSLKW